MQIIESPGGYDDGPVYLRVHRARAGNTWPKPGYKKEINDRRLMLDPEYDYVKVENSHNAFVYDRWLVTAGLPGEALAVVRPEA